MFPFLTETITLLIKNNIKRRWRDKWDAVHNNLRKIKNNIDVWPSSRNETENGKFRCV